MRPSWCSSFLPFIFLFLLASTLLAWSQELSSQPGSGAKVCVAEVNNRTGKSLFVERMTERLVRGLIEGKLAALAMDSATTSDRELRPTLENSEELKRRECNYLVLTQVADPRPIRPSSSFRRSQLAGERRTWTQAIRPGPRPARISKCASRSSDQDRPRLLRTPVFPHSRRRMFPTASCRRWIEWRTASDVT